MDLESAEQEGNTDFGTGPHPPQADDLEMDKEEFRSAKELIQFLIKTTRTFKIYLYNNPIHQKFLTEMNAKFDKHLTTYGGLKIQVQQHKLLLGNEVLYENTSRMESLAFRLYIDGIRELSFHEGLEQGEIMSFLEVVGKDSSQTHLDDDMTTLLWEKGFSHITYQVAKDSAQRVEIQAVAPPPGQLTKAFMEEVQVGEEQPQSAALTEIRQGVRATEQDLQNLTYQNVYALTEEDIAKVKHEMQAEEERDLLAEMIQILTAILQIEEDLKNFEEVVRILQDMLDLMIRRGDFYHGRRIIEVFWELQSPEKGLPEKNKEALKTAIDWAGGAERIEKLTAVLNLEEVKDLDHLYAYLILHHKNAIDPLTDLLGSLKNMKPRRILCDAMVELAREETEILTRRLKDRRWYIVRNIVYILSKIGNERVVDDLSALIQHSESQVRKEVLRAFEVLPGPKAKQYLVKFLMDEESSIRILAARSLAQSALGGKVAGTVEHLLQTIEDSKFNNRDLYEKKEIFDALGQVGGNVILPFMRKILKEQVWFKLHKGRHEELKLCAIIALKRVKTPEAVNVLKEGLALKNKNIREACARVIGELETNQG